MKLAFVLLLCSCISASMQQQSMYDSLWSYMPSWSSWQMPYSYNLIDFFSSGTGYFRGEPEPYQQPQYHPLPSVPKFKQGLQTSSHQPQLSDLIAVYKFMIVVFRLINLKFLIHAARFRLHSQVLLINDRKKIWNLSKRNKLSSAFLSPALFSNC